MAHEPSAGGLRLVPGLDDTAIEKDLARPPRFLVTGVHAEPHDEHAHIRAGILAEQIVLRPPGASDARRSRGRQQQNQTDVAFTGVEPAAYVVDSVKMLESSRGKRNPREHGRECEYRAGDRQREIRRRMSLHPSAAAYGHAAP